MVLMYPDFTVNRPSTLAAEVTDPEWWFWERLQEMEPTTQLGGFLAWKSGFHSTGDYNAKYYPSNYSIRDPVNKTGPWQWKCAACDWTFPEAQSGNYSRIKKYTQRLDASARDSNDPRLDLILYEFYGQSDTDQQVEGYNEYTEEFVTSDSSHLWHIHFSVLRSKCEDFWAFWALVTVLMGWSVAQWKASLGGKKNVMMLALIEGSDSVWFGDGLSHRAIQDMNDANNLVAAGAVWLPRFADKEKMFNSIGKLDADAPPAQSGVTTLSSESINAVAVAAADAVVARDDNPLSEKDMPAIEAAFANALKNLFGKAVNSSN